MPSYTLQDPDTKADLFAGISAGLSGFTSVKDVDGNALQVMAVNSNSAGNIQTSGTIDCTGKSVIVFDADVIVKLNGAGGVFELIAQKELGVSNLTSLEVTGTANYLLS